MLQFATMLGRLCFVSLLIIATGCGDDGGTTEDVCELNMVWETGGDGHADPLGAGADQARAGRITDANQLPSFPGSLLRWAAGDFVLANNKVAMVIEDVGPSDMYDPWGGRPVGMALVENGALSQPSNMGEILLLVGRQSVLTESVSVMNDGSNGEAAVIRVVGTPQPTPFFENIVGGLFRNTHEDMPTVIDYVLEPGADHVDVYFRFKSPRKVPEEVLTVLHGFMATPRTPLWGPEVGFDAEGTRLPYLGFIDQNGASYAYEYPTDELAPGVYQSGFASVFAGLFTIDPCAETTHHHARITIGGTGLDGLVQAVARTKGNTLRAITGTVRDANGTAQAGVRVHAETLDDKYLTRAMTDDSGNYTLHVPDATAVKLTAYRRGDAVVGPQEVGATETTSDFSLLPTGSIHVTATDFDTGGGLPARIQVLPAGSSSIPSVPDHFGEAKPVGGRLHVEYPVSGEVTVKVPVGEWEVIVSRGYEYELHRETVNVTADGTVDVSAALEHVVDTTGIMCGDFHIHTHRSADSGDDATWKLQSAVADGLDIPVRTEHEFVADFSKEIAALGIEDWVGNVGSVEMTSMEIWGHMGVVPLIPDETKVNNGTPLWQEFPTLANPSVQLRTMEPPEVFDNVRARDEQPAMIIFHPRGSKNYFDYAQYNPTTGMSTKPERWDEDFTLVEVFNSSSWPTDLGGVVADWLSFLNFGRKVFAVGSSDSHRIRSSPVGYPRTCMDLGTDTPSEVTGVGVRDALVQGKVTISGGVYVDATVNGVGPGGEVSGASSTMTVRIRVQAASWVDVDAIDVVVDGEVQDRISILPGDADPSNPTVRFDKDVTINVTPATGSYVIVAAYGNSNLDPVHPGRRPFGVTNPIFMVD